MLNVYSANGELMILTYVHIYAIEITLELIKKSLVNV